MKNKKGADKIVSVYWFAILILIAGGIFAMVTIFYSHPYDIRTTEANILGEKIADCISQGGILNIDVFSEGFNEEFKEKILENCKLNFDTEEIWEDELQYYFRVDFFKLPDLNLVFEIEGGNLNLVSNCEIEGEGYEKLAKCATNKFYSTAGSEQVLVKILTIVRKTEKNVKQ